MPCSSPLPRQTCRELETLNCLQENTVAKEKEAQEHREAAEAADALCSTLTPGESFASDGALALAAENSGGSAGGDVAPPSLLTGMCTDDVGSTDDTAAAAALNDGSGAPPHPDAVTSRPEPEPYTALDIQVCNVTRGLGTIFVVIAQVRDLGWVVLNVCHRLAVPDCAHRPAAAADTDDMHGPHDAVHGSQFRGTRRRRHRDCVQELPSLSVAACNPSL